VSNHIHEANRNSWNAKAQFWKELRDRDQLWRKCCNTPEIVFEGQALELIQYYAREVATKEICIIGSGDNYAAFALASLGASVTSVDISENQLAIAQERASTLGLEINFVRADAANLALFTDNRFDMVFSSNGFYVWIADLLGVLSEIMRILRPRGYYIFYDVHPFQRPWNRSNVERIEMVKSYWEVGPTVDEGSNTHYEFHHTMADLVNAIADAGLFIRKMVESPPSDSRFWQDFSYESGTDQRVMDWQINPRTGLPAWLTLVTQKF